MYLLEHADSLPIQTQPMSGTSGCTYVMPIEPAGKTQGAVELGLWQADPGHYVLSEGVQVDETFVVLEGEATITINGATYRLVPGTIFRLPARTPFESDVLVTVKKFFVKIS